MMALIKAEQDDLKYAQAKIVRMVLKDENFGTRLNQAWARINMTIEDRAKERGEKPTKNEFEVARAVFMIYIASGHSMEFALQIAEERVRRPMIDWEGIEK